MNNYLQTVTGLIPKHEMGITLPHEHLFNDLSCCVNPPFYPFSSHLVGQKVTPALQWGLKFDPYCCADNMSKKTIADVIDEIDNFQSLGGKTIVDATGSASIGRDVISLRAVAEKTGLNIVASTGPYLENFEKQNIHQSIDMMAKFIDSELTVGIEGSGIKAGMIGEVGVSPFFTQAEKNSLRAAALAQTNHPHISLNIHMPGWQRRGPEVLDIVLNEMGANPRKVSLAHSDPSGKDIEYQRALLDLGVWLEFDMIGLDISFPKEGVGPSVTETADCIANLIKLGYQDQIVLSHDIFLKQMWAKNGGNGWGFVPNVFLALLEQRGIEKSIVEQLCTDNPANLLA